MSSKVPLELHPIEEERRDYGGASYIEGDFSYIGGDSTSYPTSKISESIDSGKSILVTHILICRTPFDFLVKRRGKSYFSNCFSPSKIFPALGKFSVICKVLV